MKIQVSNCWAGNNNYCFRIETPDGSRFYIKHDEGEKFDRRFAAIALDELERMGYQRKNIRFQER